MSTAAPTARAVFERVNSQMRMILEIRAQYRSVPLIRPSTTTDERTAWLRDVITRHGLADIKVRPSRPETWAQAFERVCGETLA